MPRPEAGREFEQESRSPEIRFHRIGTPQAEDSLIYAAPDEPDWLPDAAVSDDDRYLIVTINRGTNPETHILVLDLTRADSGFQTLVAGFTAKAAVVSNRGSIFVVQTDDGADRGRIVAIDLDNAERRHWKELLAERGDTLLEGYVFGGRLVCHYLRDAHSVLQVFGAGWDLRARRLVAGRGVGGGQPVRRSRPAGSARPTHVPLSGHLLHRVGGDLVPRSADRRHRAAPTVDGRH